MTKAEDANRHSTLKHLILTLVVCVIFGVLAGAVAKVVNVNYLVAALAADVAYLFLVMMLLYQQEKKTAMKLMNLINELHEHNERQNSVKVKYRKPKIKIFRGRG